MGNQSSWNQIYILELNELCTLFDSFIYVSAVIKIIKLY